VAPGAEKTGGDENEGGPVDGVQAKPVRDAVCDAGTHDGPLILGGTATTLAWCEVRMRASLDGVCHLTQCGVEDEVQESHGCLVE